MCTAVHYPLNGREFRTKFPDSMACLPVKNRHGGADLLPWGRRRQQLGRLPLGGWARLDAIYGGRWDRWRPIPVKLLVSQFMEVDMEGRSRWFDVTPGKWIQGLVAHWERERRVYVVTITPEMEDAAYERWPRILSHNTTADIS